MSNIVSTIWRCCVSLGRPNRRMVYCSLPRLPWWPWCWPVLAKLASVMPSASLIHDDICRVLAKLAHCFHEKEDEHVRTLLDPTPANPCTKGRAEIEQEFEQR